MPTTRPRLQGFTLLELLLVLALVVVLASVAALNTRGGFSRHRLLKAADQVRVGWATARNDAIKTGRVQVFYHGVESDRYFHAPQMSIDEAHPDRRSDQNPSDARVQGFGAPSTQAALDDATQPVAVTHKQLPSGVKFLGADVRIDQKSAVMLSQAPDAATRFLPFNTDMSLDSSHAATNVDWGMPIYFFPDGSSSSAQLMLRNETHDAVSVYLRGLSGIAHVGLVTDADSAQRNRTSTGLSR